METVNPCEKLKGRLRSICEGRDSKCQGECLDGQIKRLIELGLIETAPTQAVAPLPKPIIAGMGVGLGDRISQALAIVGITEDKVSAWIGKPCGCSERQEKWNRVGRWASRVLQGSFERAQHFLEEILTEEKGGNP